MSETQLTRQSISGIRRSSEVVVAEEDGHIALTLDLTESDQRDPTCRLTFAFECSPDGGQTWLFGGSAETWGSAARDVAEPPRIEIPAPPSGWLVRARVETPRAVPCGCTLRSVTGSRLAVVPPPHHSVAYDNSAYITGTAVGTLTTSSFTIAGSDRAYVIAAHDNQGAITVSSTSCGGVGGTSAGAAAENGSIGIHLWYGIAPATGSQTATATWSDTFANVTLHVHTFTDVDQSTPVADYTSATGTGTAITVTVPNAVSGGMVTDAAYGGGGGTMTEGASQTARTSSIPQGFRLVTSTQDGADGGVMSWTGQFSDSWVIAGLRLVEATAAAPRFILGTH